jgi:hypothetical protein
MQLKDQTASYVEISSQTFALFTDAMSAYNKRALDYSKSLWEIASRPYASTAIETTVRENLDRTNQIVSLTIHELQTNGQNSAELAEKLVAHGTKIQETMMNSMKGLVETGISNMNFAKDSATQQFDNVSKRLEATTVSAN